MSAIGINYQDFFEQYHRSRLIMSVIGPSQYQLISVNNRACEFFGVKPDDIIGQDIDHLFSLTGAEDIVHACDKAIRSFKPVTIQAMPKFQGILREDTFLLNPIAGAEGKVTHIDMVATLSETDNISLKRQRDEAMSLMTAVFDSSHVGIFVTDSQRRMIRVNEAFLDSYGYDRFQVLGQDFADIFIDSSYDDAAAYHSHLIEEGAPQTAQEWQISGQDQATHVLMTSTRVDYSPGRHFFVHSLVDISDRKNMEQHLLEAKESADIANKAKSTFLANMSHELRTPLNAIIGFAEIMQMEALGKLNDQYKEYTRDILFSAGHLLDVINDVLDMSKIEAGKFELIENEVSPTKLCESAVKILRDKALTKDIKLVTSVPSNLPNIRADRRIMRQVLFNLLDNAMKFSESQIGFVKLSARVDPHSNAMVFQVEDNGCGMTPEDLENVVEPFNQVKDPLLRHNNESGTGLGLPLARAMMQLHGGELEIGSIPNEGTTVCITIPGECIIENTELTASKVSATS